MLPLILASTSPFRAELLARLGLPFSTFAPDINETPIPNESPVDMVLRLTQAKAQAAIEAFPQHLIIASDQCAVCDNDIIGKPADHQHAIDQLSRFSTKRITFLTGLCLLNSQTGQSQIDCVPFHVQFRQLEADQIDRYLKAEKPYNCAGSFKSEGLGISLFKKMQGDDPNALIGLPLIRLIDFLANENIVMPL